MRLTFSDLAAAVGGTLKNVTADGFVSCVSTDSRKEIPNGLFIAIPGEKFDGHDFLGAALKNGAVLLCIEEKSLYKLPPYAFDMTVKTKKLGISLTPFGGDIRISYLACIGGAEKTCEMRRLRGRRFI